MEEEQELELELELERRIITHIFHHLSVKTLLRCRYLSKSHKAMIDDPDFSVWYSVFSANHVTRSRRLFLQIYPHPEAASAVASAVAPMGYCSFSYQTYSDHVDPAKHSVVGGSCMGILCLVFDEFDVCIWNPSTRTHSHLIPPNYEYRDDEGDGTYRYLRYGLGVDGNRKSKLARLVFSFFPESLAFFGEVSVYSIQTDTWETSNSEMTWPADSSGPKSKDCEEIGWEFGKSGVSVSDRINWMVRLYGTTENGVGLFTILSLNLNDYSFSTESIPEFMMEGRSSDSLIDIDMWHFGWGESLSLYFASDSFEVVVWIRGTGKWSKMLHVEGICSRLKPLLYSSNDDKIVLLQIDSKVVWYDLRTGRNWDSAATQDGSELYDAVVYLDSCESVNGRGLRCPIG